MSSNAGTALHQNIGAEDTGSLRLHWRWVGLYFLGWAILAAIPTTAAFISARGDSFPFWLAYFVPILIFYLLWALLAPVVWWLFQRLPLTGSRALAGVAAHTALFLVITTLTPFLVHFNDWQAWLYGRHAAGFHTMSAFSYAFVLLGCVALAQHLQSRRRERDLARARLNEAMLDGQLSWARMDLLRMQINPHFLFNALNSIAALIETGRGTEAYRTTELLGGLLRSALDASRQTLVTLADELDFVERYIEIERMRFGERLRFEVVMGDAAARASVPALSLQPVVENAVKHAVAPSRHPVRITLTARVTGTGLLVRVTDDGPGPDGDGVPGTGQGLSNIAERLKLMYGTEARLTITGRPGGGTQVELALPLCAAQAGGSGHSPRGATADRLRAPLTR